MEKRFTIIIIHRNGFEMLKSVLDSVLSAAAKDDEVILVDNYSTDDSIQQIENDNLYKDIQIIRHSCNAGYGHSFPWGCI